MELINRINVDVTEIEEVAVLYKTKVLRPNILNDANVLTQEMLDACGNASKIVIKYCFTLQGGTVTIPENCIIDFDGGSFSDGTVIWTDTKVINICELPVFSNIIHQGTKTVYTGLASHI